MVKGSVAGRVVFDVLADLPQRFGVRLPHAEGPVGVTGATAIRPSRRRAVESASFAVSVLGSPGVSMAVNYGLNKVRFPSPVRVGSKIRTHGRVVSVEDVRGGVEVVVDLTVEIDGVDKPACVAQAVYRFYA